MLRWNSTIHWAVFWCKTAKRNCVPMEFGLFRFLPLRRSVSPFWFPVSTLSHLQSLLSPGFSVSTFPQFPRFGSAQLFSRFDAISLRAQFYKHFPPKPSAAETHFGGNRLSLLYVTRLSRGDPLYSIYEPAIAYVRKEIVPAVLSVFCRG